MASADAGAAVSSKLIELECARVLDRLLRTGKLTVDEMPARRASVRGILEALHRVRLDENVLSRAAGDFSRALGSLDAIHLATALLWIEEKRA